MTNENGTLKGSPNPPATRPTGQSPAGPHAIEKIVPPARRRRIPTWIWGAAGAVAVLIYGLAIERMRLGPPLVMLALGGMTLAFTAAAVWRMIDPLARLDSSDEPAAAQGRNFIRELEREKYLVLKAIKEVELDFQMRKISETDYAQMRERYARRAMRLISDLDAGGDFRTLIEKELKLRLELPVADASALPAADASAAKPSAGGRPTCPTCKTANDADAKFCKSCGGKL